MHDTSFPKPIEFRGCKATISPCSSRRSASCNDLYWADKLLLRWTPKLDHQLGWTFRGLLGKKEQTMKAKRKRHNAAFKAKVGFEALVGLKTVSQLARVHAVHPTQVTQWRATIRDHLPELFEPGRPGTEDQTELIAQLHQKIGQLTVDLDWLKKSPDNRGFDMFASTDQPGSASQRAASMRAAGESGADAAVGRVASGTSGLRQPQADRVLAPGGPGRQTQVRGAAAAFDGDRGDLRQAPDQPAGARPPNLSVSIARFGGEGAGPSLVFGHHLCADGHRIHVSGGGDGLVDRLAIIHHIPH